MDGMDGLGFLARHAHPVFCRTWLRAKDTPFVGPENLILSRSRNHFQIFCISRKTILSKYFRPKNMDPQANHEHQGQMPPPPPQQMQVEPSPQNYAPPQPQYQTPTPPPQAPAQTPQYQQPTSAPPPPPQYPQEHQQYNGPSRGRKHSQWNDGSYDVPCGHPYPKSHWKLTKGKTVYMLRLCASDQSKLFHSDTKTVDLPNGGVRVSFDLCAECVEMNMKLTDMIAPQQKKQWQGQ